MAKGLNKEVEEKLLNLIINDALTPEMAALNCDITEEQFKSYLDNSKRLQDQIQIAEAKRDYQLLKKSLDGDESARWVLSRISPSLWAKPSVSERSTPEPKKDGIRKRMIKRVPKHYEDYDTSNEPSFFRDHIEEVPKKKQIRKLKR